MVQDFGSLSVFHNSFLDIDFKHILCLGLLMFRPSTFHELYQSIIIIIIIIITTNDNESRRGKKETGQRGWGSTRRQAGIHVYAAVETVSHISRAILQQIGTMRGPLGKMRARRPTVVPECAATVFRIKLRPRQLLLCSDTQK